MWADLLAGYAMWMMMLYLTNVWKLNFTHAAAIINVFWGLTAIMLLPMQFLADAFMGNYWMLLISSFAYSAVPHNHTTLIITNITYLITLITYLITTTHITHNHIL
ncbi:hypothetical protein HYC85_000827 [Camellia sinensis]|uniref:Uncharacterized protein n=1 Tax=Camellia sinensis TaxID=4442 RepID=A0A7J7I654_CAMSI|nr:hypothetical protein HYC85_000827 [Camellia sinensis]